MTGEQLKKSILQYAVEGKLVPQNLKDEPASVLIEKIREEKERLIEEKVIKRDKNESFIYRKDGSFYEKIGKNEICIDEELPFEIPDNWEWARLEEVTYKLNPQCIKNQNILEKGIYPVVTQGERDIDGYYNDDNLVVHDIPLILFGDHTRNVQYINFNFIVAGDGAKFFKPIMLAEKYMYYVVLYTSYKIKNRGYARHFSLLNKEYYPIPPLAEQERIVAKIEELMPLVEEYGVTKEKMNRLNEELPEKMKKSILQYAIEGKLVPQNLKDEPASVLIEKIKEEKERLIEEKVINKDKKESFIYRKDRSFYEKIGKKEICIDEELPFDIPDNWEWARLSSLAIIIMGQSPKGSSVGENIDGIEFHQGKKNFGEDYINNSNIYTDEPKKIIDVKSIIMSVRAPVGDVNIVDRKICIGRGLCGIVPIICNLSYLYYYIKMLKKYFELKSTGTTFKAISNDIIMNSLIAIPPLAEQERIVAKIEEILPMIEKLK